MEYTGEGVQALVSVMDDMQNTNLILVDKKLKSLLKCLAFYDEFRIVLSYCNAGFDYQAEKKKALQKIGDNRILRLPKTPKALVAFVSNLLIEFDLGGLDFVSFAGNYFPAQNKQVSFDLCFAGMLEPFKEALASLVVEGVEEEPQVVERNVEFAANGLQQQTEYLLVNMVNAVRESQLAAQERDEICVILEGFAAALDSRDSLMIKSVWFGLKRALAECRLCEKEAAETDKLLKLYLVIK